MHKTRRFIFFTLLACMALSHPLPADEGDCYTEARSCVIRPSWALGGLVVVAVLAIALQRNGSCHGEHHSKLHNSSSSSHSKK